MPRQTRPNGPVAVMVDLSQSERLARIEAMHEAHGHRCGRCGFPLDRGDEPCPNCVERATREANRCRGPI